MKRIFPGVIVFLLLFSASCSWGGDGLPMPTDLPQPTAEAAPADYSPRTNPSGIVLSRNDGKELAFYDLEGSLLGTRTVLPQGSVTDRLQVFGPAAAGVDLLQVMQVRAGNDETIVLLEGEEIFRQGGVLTGFAAVPGQPMIALATADKIDSGLLWQISLVTPETLPDEEPSLSVEMPYGGAIAPLHIEAAEGVPVGIWYTHQPYALGGEIFFYPTRELHRLDLASGVSEETTISEGEIYLPSISPDGSLLAYVDLDSLNTRLLAGGETHSFAILPESENGAGDAVFSPENGMIAWKESSGSNLMPIDYLSVVRIAQVGAGIRHDLQEAYFESASGYPIGDLEPIAWVNETILLVEIADENAAQETWLLDVSGPSLQRLGEGTFTGFLYP